MTDNVSNVGCFVAAKQTVQVHRWSTAHNLMIVVIAIFLFQPLYRNVTVGC